MIARSSEELEIPMHKLRITPKLPIGLAFDIADLMFLEGWSETHNIRMVVELDHCVEDEEYDPLALCQRYRRAATDRPHLSLQFGRCCAGQPARDAAGPSEARPPCTQAERKPASCSRALRDAMPSLEYGDASPGNASLPKR